MSRDTLCVGRSGEDEAVSFLRNSGYRIIARNYRTKLGEIDIIAAEGGALCFIEVKTRRSMRCGSGVESVSPQKQRQVSKAALQFVKDKNFWDRRARFDVVSIRFDGGRAEAQLFKNAFELDKRFSI